jgi:methylated-DNA-[protein]-cysteine S-methyltransferase
MNAFPLPTPYGDFIAIYSEKGLAGVYFPERQNEVLLHPDTGKKVSAKIRDWHRTTLAAVKKFFDGQKAKLPPLDLEGTDFQKSVWHQLLKIKPGSTKSYGEVAHAVGRPRASRAVGSACGCNPIPLFIPCHRVLAANKKIGGFGSGLDWKKRLLAVEGINF